MKLHTLKEVNSEIQKERKNQIDDGKTLGEKVSRIRATYSTEQKQLDDFRLASVGEMNSLREKYKAEKDEITADIAKLLEIRAQASAPIEIKLEEAQAILLEMQKNKALLNEEESRLNIIASSLKSKASKIQRLENALKSREAQIEMRDLASISRSEEVSKRDEIIEKRFVDTEEIISESYRLLDNRAVEIGERMVNLEIREAHVAKKQKEQETKERQINDKYQTLLRTIKRTNG